MVFEEIEQHRKALEAGDWLKGGEIIQLWNRIEEGYALSFYVVAYTREKTDDMVGGNMIYCFRVFGGVLGGPAMVSADQVAHFIGGQPMTLQNNPNWRPYKAGE